MRDWYLEREALTVVEEEHDDVNKANILGLTNDVIVFQVYNIEEMARKVEKHNDDD
jgi:hypothetical protein